MWTEGPVGYKRTQGQLISTQWTGGPVGYSGTRKLKILKERRKIAPKGISPRKIIDKCLESSIDSQCCEQNRDMMTGANATPHRVPDFLTGRPMQSRDPLQRQNSINEESQNTVPQVPETTNQTIPSDHINRLANGRHAAQTLMVRPVSTTTLTFDGKSENSNFSKTSSKH